jgi:hypothetical protein
MNADKTQEILSFAFIRVHPWLNCLVAARGRAVPSAQGFGCDRLKRRLDETKRN